MQKAPKKVWKRVVTGFLYVLGGIIALLLVIFLLLQTPWGKARVKAIAVNYLENKLKTRVSIGSLSTDWFNRIEIRDLYLEDQSKQELISIGSLNVQYDLWDILSGVIQIPSLSIDRTHIHLARSRTDSAFNFDFITKAFVSPNPVPGKIDTTKKNKFNIGKLSITHTRFEMEDDFGGQQYTANIGSLDALVREMDIDKMEFRLYEFLVDSVQTAIHFSDPFLPKKISPLDSTNPVLFISSDTIALTRVDFNLDDIPSHMHIETRAKQLSGRQLSTDLFQMLAKAESLTLLDHSTAVDILSSPTKTDSANSVSTAKPFRFNVDRVNIANNDIRFNDSARPAVGRKGVMDYSHLFFQNLNLNTKTVAYDGKTYFVQVSALNFQEQSGFQVKSFAGTAAYNDTGVVLKKGRLQTGMNKLEADASIAYRSFASITSEPSRTKIIVAVSNANLKLDELLYFQPDLARNESFRPLLGKEFFISTTATGTLNNLRIPDVQVKQGGTSIRASAEVLNLPDTKKLVVNLYLKQLVGSRDEILALLPRNTIPDSLLHYVPPHFNVKGVYKGSLQNMYTDLQLTSDYGNATVKGTLKNITDKNKASYDLVINAQQLKLDRIMDDTTYGAFTGNLKVKGTGLDIHRAIATADVTVDEFNYRGYTYHSVKAKGNLQNNTIHADLQSADPNFDLSSVTNYNMSAGKGSFETQTHIRHLDLLQLGFTTDSLMVAGDLVGDVPVLDSTRVNGDVFLTNLHLTQGVKSYRLDSIVFSGRNEHDTQTMQLRTPFLNAWIKGKYTLQSLGPAITTLTNKYVYTKVTDTVFGRPIVANFNVSVNAPDSILQFVPGLKVLTPFSVIGNINTDSSKLILNTQIPRIVYNNYIVDSFALNVYTDSTHTNTDRLHYLVGIKRMFGPGFSLDYSYTTGYARRGIVDGSFRFLGDNNELRYLLPYKITNDSSAPYVQIPDSLILDKQTWNSNADNKVFLNIDKLKGSRLRIFRGEQSISILADSTVESGLPLRLVLTKFDLDNISNIIISDTSFVDGNANGYVEVRSFAPFWFTSDLEVENLAMRSVPTGNLVAKVTSGVANSLDVDIQLKGEKNNVTLGGTYNTHASEANLKLHLQPLDLQAAAPFTTQWLGKLIGRLHGDLDITGSLSAPKVRGKLVTDSVETIYRTYGTTIRMPSSELVFDEGGVTLNNFNFLDSLGNDGQLTGRLLTTDYRNFKYDLKLMLDSFQVVGRRKLPDQNIYGPTHVNANLTLKTDEADVLQIDGRVRVVDKSSFTYVYVPDVSSQTGEGLIEFFNPAIPVDTILQQRLAQKAAAEMKIAVNLQINVTPASEVVIMMDEISGDHLLIKGSADLNFAMSPDGRQNLTGIYTVESGEYDLSIAQLIRKTFIIQKGSSLAWSGDPLRAEMNITALYKVKTSSGELVNDIQSVPGIDKQKLDFEVYLLLTGQLLKPDINFRLDMEENDQAAFNGVVYNRLKQVNSMPAELNKQVMGLLALNHFIADNPFSSLSGGGTSMQTQAFATAGNLITQELTDLVGNVIKDVNIDFALDVNDDFTTGQAIRNTNLKVGLSKSLANNRLSVYVGSSFALEGQNQDANALSGLAGDVTVEYQLTSDGRYRLKAYRINQNELTFQGTIVKTGVTFLVVLEFNRLKNAFRKGRSRT